MKRVHAKSVRRAAVAVVTVAAVAVAVIAAAVAVAADIAIVVKRAGQIFTATAH